MARSTTPSQYVATAWYLEYVGGGSDKFYEVVVTENNICVLRWGRRGSTGSTNATAYSTYDEARDQALKQVFAKKSKGYVAKYDGQNFVATTQAIDYARNGNPLPLHDQLMEALRNGAFDGAKASVLKHYSEFAEQVKTLLDRAGDGSNFERTMQEYEQVEKVWEEINDKHAEVSAAMSIAKATLMQQLMAGTL